MVATTVFMITLADITGKANAALFINIPDITPAFTTVRTSSLASRAVFLQMESVLFTHGPLILLWLHSALLHFEKIARYLDKMKVQ